MTSDTTTPTTDIVTATSIGDEWRSYWRFIKRPALCEKPSGINLASLTATMRLFLLDLVMMTVLILLASMVMASGFEPPANVFDDLEWTPVMVLSAIALIPLAEEILFRGWLSGKPSTALAILAIGAAPLAIAYGGTFGVIAGILGGLGMLVAAIVIRRLPSPDWFKRFFVAAFWFSTLAFAALHMLNYSGGSVLTLLPLVIPQFVSGSIFGFARVRYGIWSGVILHMLHNGVIIGSILSATSAPA